MDWNHEHLFVTCEAVDLSSFLDSKLKGSVSVNFDNIELGLLDNFFGKLSLSLFERGDFDVITLDILFLERH